MCLAVPLKIVEINGTDGIGEAAGVKRQIRLDFIHEPKIGDYVIVHAGFAIEKLSEKQAIENLEAIMEVANELASGI